MKTYEVIHNSKTLAKRKFSIEITTRYNIFGWKIEKIVPYRVGISVDPNRTQIMRFNTADDAQTYIDQWLAKTVMVTA